MKKNDLKGKIDFLLARTGGKVAASDAEFEDQGKTKE
jgi:hypothetical protein